MERTKTPLPPLVAVIGPTASGKTALGESLALRFNGEIVSADAKQVYRGMDIGTAKEKALRVPQHLLDIKDPGEKITVGEYQALAYAAIDDIGRRGRLPLLVGGSMLYADAVTEGYRFGGPGGRARVPRYRSLRIGIAWDRKALKERAAGRLRERMRQGLADEVRGLLEAGVDPEWLRWCGIEYRHFSAYVQGEASLEEAVRDTERAIFEYIRRQYVWWRRHADVKWVQDFQEAEALVAVFLGSNDVLY